MIQKALICCFIVSVFALNAQDSGSEFEKYPVFPQCENEDIQNLKNCFINTLQSFIYQNFNTPQIVFDEVYSGQMVVFFEVTREGEFKVLALDAIYQELKDELQRVFDELPKIKPATYNARPTFVQFTLPIKVPLLQPDSAGEADSLKEVVSLSRDLSAEYDDIQNLGFSNEKYNSNINIPLSHQDYARIDFYMNQVGNNAHTA